MPLLTHLASAVCYVGVVDVAPFTTLPRGFGFAEQRVDRGTLFIGWGDLPQVQIHQSSPAAARGSARSAAYAGALRTGSTRTAQALNSAVPDFGSVALIVSRFVSTASGKCSVMKTTPGRSPRSM